MTAYRAGAARREVVGFARSTIRPPGPQTLLHKITLNIASPRQKQATPLHASHPCRSHTRTGDQDGQPVSSLSQLPTRRLKVIYRVCVTSLQIMHFINLVLRPACMILIVFCKGFHVRFSYQLLACFGMFIEARHLPLPDAALPGFCQSFQRLDMKDSLSPTVSSSELDWIWGRTPCAKC